MQIELKVPAVGESISEVEIGEWKKTKDQPVGKDEPLVVLESEKATVELPSPVAGTLTRILKEKGQTAQVGEVIAYLEEGDQPAARSSEASAAPHSPPTGRETQPRVMPAAQRALASQGLAAEQVPATGPGGRLLKEDVLRHLEAAPSLSPEKGERADTRGASPPAAPAEQAPPALASATPAASPLPPLSEQAPSRPSPEGDRDEEVVPMTRLRRTVAARLVQAQHSAALLTTFNEVDMSSVMALRKEIGEAFQARHGAKLGFMSFFVKAATDALLQIPQVNAEIRDQDIVYHRYCDIGIAVGGGKGLVVPVLRDAQAMSFAKIELAIADFSKRARENKLRPEELQGGTFTISNGGVYGSLLSTPIVNPPQSGVLGMHAIQERPVVREGQVVVRPMMYIALTYDHRLVDGREAVTFLKRVKEVIGSPVRMLLEV